EKMLSDEFRKLEESVSKAETSNETKIKDAIALFTASTEESQKKHREGVKEAMMQHRKDVLKLPGNTGMMLLGMVIFLFTVSGGTLWYFRGRIHSNREEIMTENETLVKLNATTGGVPYYEGGDGRFLVVLGGLHAVTHWTMENGSNNT
ncbi:mobilization protein, partial [Shigella flexneri]|uniref:MbeB family mobilization protein n=1 Tax=Shigella flexneri TaxID=623 RepID=UPI0012E99017